MYQIVFLWFLIIFLITIPAAAAPGILADSPLAITRQAPPTILAWIDNSPPNIPLAQRLLEDLLYQPGGLADGTALALTTSNSRGEGITVTQLAEPLDEKRRTVLQRTVSQLVPATNPGPIPAEALQDLGRYLVEGVNQAITLVPGSDISPAYTLFDHAPSYPASASSPVRYTCGKHFALLISGGYQGNRQDDRPTSTALRDYAQRYRASPGGPWLDDIAWALAQLDLRPDLSGTLAPLELIPLGVDTAAQSDGTLQQALGPKGGYFAESGNGGSSTSSASGAVLARLYQDSHDTRSTGWYSLATPLFAFTLGADLATLSDAQLARYLVIRPFFNPSTWQGDLKAYPLQRDGRISTASLYSATQYLDQTDPSLPGQRHLYTYQRRLGSPAQAVPFRWENLTLFQQQDLSTSPSGVLDGNGPNRLATLRGENSQRLSRLGDMVNSDPIFTGSPSISYPTTPPFPPTRPDKGAGLVYVGANDGWFHAFDLALPRPAGRTLPLLGEVFGYLPEALYATEARRGLHHLTDPTYPRHHRFYVDGSPGAGPAYLAGRWTWVVASGLGNGGTGLFALDDTGVAAGLTDPTAQAVLWEFNATDHPDIGHIHGPPSIVPLCKTARQIGHCPLGQLGWFVVTGNGYNPELHWGNPTRGQAGLVLLDIQGGADGEWSPEDYRFVATGVGQVVANDCHHPHSQCNGLSTPVVVDVDGDSVGDLAYAGDVQGNLWAFDLRDTRSPPPPRRLFIGDYRHPLIQRPEAVLNWQNTAAPTLDQPNLLVLFASGQYLTALDKTDRVPQALYQLWDHGQTEPIYADQLPSVLLTTTMKGRVLNESFVSYQGDKPDPGCRVVLSPGERVIRPPTLRGDEVYFTTLIPADSQTGQYCGFDVEDSISNVIAIHQGTCGSPSPQFDLNHNNFWHDDPNESSKDLPVDLPLISGFTGVQLLNNQLVNAASTEAGIIQQTPVALIPGDKNGVYSWREIEIKERLRQ